mmetsp:Transcript_18004/g.37466  ORF Transcript_18004/g.37466 Transcript_18004/m.37466 type:complete len:269 (+) Transcript_18004:1048-1854(+)
MLVIRKMKQTSDPSSFTPKSRFTPRGDLIPYSDNSSSSSGLPPRPDSFAPAICETAKRVFFNLSSSSPIPLRELVPFPSLSLIINSQLHLQIPWFNRLFAQTTIPLRPTTFFLRPLTPPPSLFLFSFLPHRHLLPVSIPFFSTHTPQKLPKIYTSLSQHQTSLHLYLQRSSRSTTSFIHTSSLNHQVSIIKALPPPPNSSHSSLLQKRITHVRYFFVFLHFLTQSQTTPNLYILLPSHLLLSLFILHRHTPIVQLLLFNLYRVSGEAS